MRFVLVNRTSVFDKWLDKLKDRTAKFIITSRIGRIEIDGYLGDYKSVGDNVYELRIDYGCGYRVYFTYNGNEIIILLCGGDKSTQQKDIEKAKIINKQKDKLLC